MTKGLSIEMKTPPAYRTREYHYVSPFTSPEEFERLKQEGATFTSSGIGMVATIDRPVPDFLKPRNDRVLIQRIDEPQSGLIVSTEIPKGIKGIVLAAGPGKWHVGEWWLIKGEWKWFDAYREPLDVKPGMTVYFNSKWNDLASDYQEKHIPLDFELRKLHLVQEADIFAIAG